MPVYLSCREEFMAVIGQHVPLTHMFGGNFEVAVVQALSLKKFCW